ncbi:MAG: hypothetical protein E7273_13810 [Pseudobutyrivibrio ruminis]|nr:hypothetical protein [Pseudobutyrivibrio ruminis]
MSDEELNLIYIGSKVEDIIVSLLNRKKIVFLTGNPGDGKTYLIKRHLEEFLKLNVYIELDLNSVANYEEVAKKIISCYEKNEPAIVAVNEYPFYLLCKVFKHLSADIYEETMKVKKDCIVYDLPDSSIKKIAIVDLNERSLLNMDQTLISDLIDKIVTLLESDEIQNKQLRRNLDALKNEAVRRQILDLFSFAATSCDHFAVRDILGAISFMLTACATDEYEDFAYYDAIFESSNCLLSVIQQFDPIFLTQPSLDEALWNGELTSGWYLEPPDKWPNSQEFDDYVDEAVNCFKSIKRKYYFEHENGKALAELQPDEIKRCTNIFISFESQKRQIKERLIKSINKLFLPSSDEKKILRIWTTHRYDFSMDSSTAISCRYIDSSELDIKMPRPNDWLEGMEYVPNHIILKPIRCDEPKLVLDVDFLRTLDAVEHGYPVGLLASQYEQAVSTFFRQLVDRSLSNDNDDGEIIVACRKKNYKKSVFITDDDKYYFED